MSTSCHHSYCITLFLHELNTLDACWIAVDVWSNSSRCRQDSVYLLRMWCLYTWLCLDSLIMIRFSINCLTVIRLPTLCYFLREATSEIYGPRVYSLSYLLWDLFLFALFSDLLFQKPKNTLLHFLFTYFVLCFIQIYLSKLIQINISFYRGGTDNPSYMLGCEDFCVCMYHLHSVAWFSYLIDTLVS